MYLLGTTNKKNVLETRKAVNFVGGHFRPAASALKLAKFKQLESFFTAGVLHSTALFLSLPVFTQRFAMKPKSYLTENPPRFCVLVVDAANVQYAYERLPKRRAEYEDLFKTAANKVGKMVIFPLSTYPFRGM